MPLVALVEGYALEQAGDGEEAAASFIRAADGARTPGLLPLALETETGAARPVGANGSDEAASHVEAAGRLIDEPKGRFADATLASSFAFTARRVLTGAAAGEPG